jgi:hypothetical protein
MTAHRARARRSPYVIAAAILLAAGLAVLLSHSNPGGCACH